MGRSVVGSARTRYRNETRIRHKRRVPRYAESPLRIGDAPGDETRAGSPMKTVQTAKYWLTFVTECRSDTISGSAKLFVNKVIFAVRHILRRVPLFRPEPHAQWLDRPFPVRGLTAWSPTSSTWYVLEDEGSAGAMTRSRVEPEEWMTDILEPGMTVIDIGAHQGRYALEFARRVGATGFVVAVEPDEKNLKVLARNLELNGVRNIRTVRGACWSRREPLQFLQGSTLDVSRVLPGAGTTDGLIGLPLDDLVADLALHRVDVIKIDVEGAELDVLAGGQTTLNRFAPRLYVECHGTMQALADWLDSHNYKVKFQMDDPQNGDGFGWIWAIPVARRLQGAPID
jgi:FkbM family methyltransferase